MLEFTTTDAATLRYALDDYTDPWRPSPTLILLHAVMGSSRRFYRWVPPLARRFRIVRLDMRGHGESMQPGERPLSLARLVDDVIELADHLGCDAFHLAGASAGGIIALQAALDHPERVRTLGCFATPPGLRGHTRIDHEQWMADIRTKGLRAFVQGTVGERFPPDTNPSFVRWFVDEAAKTDVEFLFRFIPLMRSIDQSGRLGAVRVPTLAVVPGADPHIAPEQYQILRRIPDCEFLVYEGLQHNIVDAAPERCAADLLRFIERSERRNEERPW
jgi:3-oxoadipate enol-lactonase